MFDTRKRKRHADHSNGSRRNHRRDDQDGFRGYQFQNRGDPGLDSTLFIQAHEADLRRGPQARELARSLEVVVDPSLVSPHDSPTKIGSALIRWAGGSGSSSHAFDDQEDMISLGARSSAKDSRTVQDTSGIWVDR